MKNNSFRKWLVLSALFGLMCISPHLLLRAQSTANYAFSTNTTGSLGLDMNGNVVDMSTGTTQLVAADLDDNASAVTNIGFNFVLYGSAFTQFSANSNGLIQLGGTVVAGAGYLASGGSVASPRLGALVADLRTGAAGKVHYKLVGTAPNRCLVVEFLNMSITYVASPGSNDGTYQVRLYESTGVIEYVYGSMYKNNSNTTSTAINTGFSVGTAANTLASVTTSTNTVSYTTYNSNTYTNATNIANLHSTTDGSRRVYTFTPPAPPAAPTALSFTGVSATGMTLNWTDNSTTEAGYNVYRSVDNVNYTLVGQLAANTITYAASSLSPSTLYYWKVVSYAELESTPLTGSQSTTAGAISGVKTVGSGGDYQNLTTAFADINAQALGGNVELQLITGYPATPETYPIQSSNTSAVGAFTVKVYPTVSGLSITSANATGTLNLNNAANLTFDGRVNQTGANDLVISNTNAGANSYAVQFVNDAKSNTLQYLTIHSVNNSTSSGTIVFGGSTGTSGNDNNLIDHCDIKDGASTPFNAIYSAGTSTSLDNSGNTVSNSNIYNYFSAANNSNGILLSSNSSAWTINANKFYQTGTRTITAGSQHRGINIITSSGNGYVITNNVIGYASSTGTGVTTYTASAGRFFGIELTASNTGTASSIQGNTISGISLTSTSGATTAPGLFAGISILGGTVSVGDITPNIIGASTGTGAISISNSASANIFGIHANSSGTLNIVNNVISSISGVGSAAAVSCGITGINTSGGGTALTITGNTIGSATANAITSGTLGTTTATTAVAGISAGAFTTLTINGNTINNVKCNSSGTSSTLKGIYADASPTTLVMNNNTVSNLSMVAGTLTTIEAITPTTLTSNGNTVFNASVTGASGTIYGMRSSTTQFTYNNNVIHDLTIPTNSGSSSSVVYGIYNGGSPTVENITNSQIYNLSIAGATTSTSSIIAGILTNTTGSSVKNFSGNQINGLSFANSSTGTATVSGISSSSGATISIFKNKIYNLSSAGSGSTVNGIITPSGTTVNIYNNVIGDLKAPTASAADPIRAISITSTATATYRVYYNSVYLNASSTGTNFGTSGIYHAASATSTTAVLDMRNNIIVNESTPAGTGISVAFRRSGAPLGNFAATSNRNFLYAGVPSATRLVMYDGTTSYQTITTYQAAVLPREANSFAGEAAFTGAGYGTAGNYFISTTPSNANYLKPVAGITTQAESGALNITTPAITDDYAAVIRQGNAGYTGTGTAPDVGAFEFEGVSSTPVITFNSITPSTTAQCTATARLISVNITTASGTVTGATIGYTVNGVAQTNIVMTNTSGTTWEGTIPVPTPVNAVISWGVAAVNSLGVTGSYTGSSYSDEPLFGSTVSATASAGTICVGSPSVLTAKIEKNVNVTIGNGTSTTGDTEELTAFCNRRSSYKIQTLYTAAELTAAGLTAGPITSVSYNIATLGSSASNSAFTVKIGTSALTALTDYVASGSFTTVFPAANYTHAVGQNVINFSTPFNWDGTSNIIIEVTHTGVNSTNNAQTYYTNTTGNMVAYNFNGAATGTLSNKRFNIIFAGSGAPAIQSISWSDGAATVGTTNPLSVSPTATTTYTATITAGGCAVTPSPSVSVTVNPIPATPTAVNSAQCGVQVPTANVTSTSGLPTPTFNWYPVSTGGTASQSSTSTTFTSTVATTTTFYVSELNPVTGCESARVPVTVTVSTPDQISLTPSATAICLGGSVTLTAANTGAGLQNYTYSTESATTGSGAETPLTGASVTATPTAVGSFTYTVTGVDGGCAATATATVTVNELPNIGSATATPATVCSGANINLAANIGSGNPGPFVIGAGANTGSSGYYSPFYHLFGGVKSQFVIRASELTAAGLTSGYITSVALNIGTVGTTYAGFTVHVGTTANADLSGGLIPTASLTQVYSNASLALTPSSLNTFTFSAPIFWNGTSNLVVQTSWSNVNSGGSYSEVQYDNTSYVAGAYYRADDATAAAILAEPTATNTISSRPKMTFTMSLNGLYNWSWSPGTGLNTASATTSITNNSGSAVNQVFTVTATNPTTGCMATATTPAVTINPAPVSPVANNGTRCGAGVPTVSVTGSGTPGNTYSWYLTATGGTALPGETGSSLSAYSISTTTTFYVSEGNGTCSSGRTAVTATVTPAPTVSVAGTAIICNGSSTALTASSSNDPNYTYTWSGGLGTGATVNASPTANTTYTVTANDLSGGTNNGCVASATISITVNPAPPSSPVIPATATICAGTVQNLTSAPVTVSNTAILGTGTTAPGATAFPNPFNAWYGGVKHQILFTAAELAAQGLVTGSQITSVALDVNAFVGNACTNFTIRMGNTSNTALTGFVTGTSTVYGPTTYTPSATGIVTFTLTTPFTWNGTSNIVVETVHNAGNSGNGSGTRTNTTTTTANTVYYGARDNVAGGIAGFDALTSWTNSGASNLRPNIRFAYTTPLSPTWSPAGSLYTDAAGTTAYTGTATSSIYAKPTTTTTYTATFTGSNGCTTQSSATITVNQPSTSSTTVTECDSYLWNGTTYTTSGVYTHTATNSVGCDSIATLNLTIKHSTDSIIPVTACSSYTWAQTGLTYNTSGLYRDTIANAAGCDSVITLNLTINMPSSATVTATGCGSYVWALNGQTYTTSGSYTHTIPNSVNCDSVVTLVLTMGQANTGIDTQVACETFTWIDGVEYTASTNTPTFTLTNASGCDSVVTLHLTINQNTGSTVAPVTICGSYTWPLSGQTYTTSGAYTHTIPNAAGCDSVITLNLTIHPQPVVTITNNGDGSFVASSTVSGTIAWLNCTTNTLVPGATTSTFTPTANGSYAAIVTTVNGCSDTSACLTITNVGIKENSVSAISVHPNPTHDFVIVTMEAASATVDVFDAQGKLVQTAQIKSGDQIDLGAYERGVYTLKIKTEIGTSVERIVKN